MKHKVVFSFRCLTCWKLTIMSAREYNRVWGTKRVACAHCGGPTDETDASFKRRTGKTRSQAAKDITSAGILKPFKCFWCDATFRGRPGLNLHVRDHHPGHWKGPEDE